MERLGEYVTFEQHTNPTNSLLPALITLYTSTLNRFAMSFSEEPKMSELEWVTDPKDPSGWSAVVARPNAGARLVGHPR